MNALAVMAFGVFISSVSQVFLKKEAIREHSSWIREYLNFRVLFAYGIFFLATVCSIYAYRTLPLSLGAAIEATGYVYITVFGALFFGERPTGKKLIALGLIIVGVISYSLA